MNVKRWLSDFPGQNGGTVTALFLILMTGLVVVVKLALGHPFPANYESWFLVLVALAGVNVAGMGIKRVTDYGYKAAGTSAVTVEAPSSVTVQTAAPPAAAPVVGWKDGSDEGAI